MKLEEIKKLQPGQTIFVTFYSKNGDNTTKKLLVKAPWEAEKGVTCVNPKGEEHEDIHYWAKRFNAQGEWLVGPVRMTISLQGPVD